MKKFVEKDVAENPLYHDTWKLLKKYRDVVWSLEISVQHVRAKFEIEYGTSIEEFLDSVYLAGADLNGSDIEHHAKCIERSHKMLKLLDSAVELLRTRHKNGEAYHAYLDLFRCGREAIENHPPAISEMALSIVRKVIRDLEADKREYEFSALTPEQQVVELQRAEQARKEWKAHIAQLREKQGRVLKSEDLEASQS